MASKHDALVNIIADEIKNRGRWESVKTEVPFYWSPNHNQKRGQADILTNRYLMNAYFEIKTGCVTSAIRTAKKQAKAFYGFMSINHPTNHPYFVVYNPKFEYRPMIGRFRRIHNSVNTG